MSVISKIVVVESYYLPRVYYLFTKNQVLSAMSWLEARKKIDFFFLAKELVSLLLMIPSKKFYARQISFCTTK